MYWQYSGYVQGHIPLATMGYFCLDYLEHISGGRLQVVTEYRVSDAVLRKLGNLTSERGGREARKGVGGAQNFSGQERAWVQEAIRALIRRVAEKAANPTGELPEINMGHLPKL
jgi:hypothetical protein